MCVRYFFGSVRPSTKVRISARNAARALNYAAVHERIEVATGARPAASISRAMTGIMETTTASACFEVLGAHAMAHGSVAERQLSSGTTAPLAAGSLEVQLNLVARLALDLPKG